VLLFGCFAFQFCSVAERSLKNTFSTRWTEWRKANLVQAAMCANVKEGVPATPEPSFPSARGKFFVFPPLTRSPEDFYSPQLVSQGCSDHPAETHPQSATLGNLQYHPTPRSRQGAMESGDCGP